MTRITRILLVLVAGALMFAVPAQAQTEDPETPSDGTAPDCPINLAGTAPETGGVFFSWTLRSSTDVNVYRAQGDGEFEFLERLEFPATRYLDHDAEPGVAYSYQVTAIDENGTESEACETITVTAVPFFPTWLGAAAGGVIAIGAYGFARRRG